MISPGEPAPDFELADHGGRPTRLADFRGRNLVLAFYPHDFSPACSDQLSIYQEVLREIEAAGVTLVGVSVDSTWTHRAFRKALGLEMTLLSDFEPKGEVTRRYGAYLPELGHANRSLVLIDAGGAVRWVHESPSPGIVPGANLIFDAIASLA